MDWLFREKPLRGIVPCLLFLVFVLVLGSEFSNPLRANAQDQGIPIAAEDKLMSDDSSDFSVRPEVTEEFITEMLLRYLAAVGEDLDEESLDAYVMETLGYIDEIEAIGGREAVDEYLEYAFHRVEMLELEDEQIEKSSESGMGDKDGWQTHDCICRNLDWLCYNNDCVVAPIYWPFTPGHADQWSCIVEKQDCGCDFQCYESGGGGVTGPALDDCENYYAACANYRCPTHSGSEGAPCKVIVPCNDLLVPHCRGYTGHWDPDDHACIYCTPGSPRQVHKLADASERCIHIGNGAACVNIDWAFDETCRSDEEGYCESACGAPAACDEKLPSQSCGTKSCPSDFCAGSVRYDYPSTCTKTCDSSCNCDCTCTATPIDCNDGAFCNGQETCSDGTCHAGINPCPDDDIWCNGVEACDEDNDQCTHSGDPCPDDDLFCNGTESCDEVDDQCLHSGDPCSDGNDCTDDICNEQTDLCEYPCNATGYEDPCCEDPVCSDEPVCEPPCIDSDGDGYGDPANPNCTYPEWDCDDTDPNVNPGVVESEAAGNCSDGKDNDCDGHADGSDPDCPSGDCIDNDGDGYGNPASADCPFPQWDCDDSDPYINPGQQGNDCSNQPDGKDNDCDGMIDEDMCGCFIGMAM